MKIVTTLLESERTVELGNPNTSAKVKLCLFLCIPAVEIVCSETEVL